jgi:hypothetical protein
MRRSTVKVAVVLGVAALFWLAAIAATIWLMGTY